MSDFTGFAWLHTPQAVLYYALTSPFAVTSLIAVCSLIALCVFLWPFPRAVAFIIAGVIISGFFAGIAYLQGAFQPPSGLFYQHIAWLIYPLLTLVVSYLILERYFKNKSPFIQQEEPVRERPHLKSTAPLPIEPEPHFEQPMKAESPTTMNRPTSVQRNTPAARHHMQLCYNYLMEWGKEDSHYAGAEKLRFAAKHLAEARAADPQAILTVVEGKDTLRMDVDALSAMALYFEAIHVFRGGKCGRKTAREVVQMMEKATSLRPNALYLTFLSRCYVAIFERTKALHTLQRALQADPRDMDARRILDKIEANPKIGERPLPWQLYPGAFVGFGIVGMIAGGFMWLFSNPAGAPIFLMSGIGFLTGWFTERNQQWQTAVEEVTGYSRDKL